MKQDEIEICESVILAAFLELAQAMTREVGNFKAFNKFAVKYQREKARRNLQAWSDTRQPARSGRRLSF